MGGDPASLSKGRKLHLRLVTPYSSLLLLTPHSAYLLKYAGTSNFPRAALSDMYRTVP
jgi:hypothetical protein